MDQPKVVIVGPVAVSWINPSVMRYGGVERVCWRIVELLANLGWDVIPTGPADSEFTPGVSTRGLWPGESWCSDRRDPKVHIEDTPRLERDYSRHVALLLYREMPDVVLFLGPSPEMLSALVAISPRLIARSVVALHNGPNDNVRTVPQLTGLSQLKLLALSERQREAFGHLSERIEVLLDGIPVPAIPFSPDPRAARAKLARKPLPGLPSLDPSRPLIAQIDYLHPSKGMLISLEMFKAAGLFRSHDLVLAGGMGWQLPSRMSGLSEGDRYLATIRKFVGANKLGGSVHILDGLTGVQTSRLFGCADLVVSPVRMDHGSMWDSPSTSQDPESYGQGRATANAAGTPVLMSNRYDPSFTPPSRPDLIFDNFDEGVESLGRLVLRGTSTADRVEMREFALARDSLVPGFKRYVEIVIDYFTRSRGIGCDVTESALDGAVNQLIALETAAQRDL